MADHKDIRKIGRRFGGDPCFIDAAGKIHFLEGREKMELPAALQDGGVVDAVCGNDHGVALLENGEAVVFGRRYEEAMDESSGAQGTATPRWPLPPPEALQKVKALAALKTHAATLHDDGTVSVWGWEGAVAWEPEAKMKPVLQIAAAMDALRMLDADGQVWTFPLPRSTHPDQPVGFNGKLLLLDKEAVRLRDQVWQRKDGTWSGDKIDSRTMELLQSGHLEAGAVFALAASTSPEGPFGYLLRVEPVGAASTSPSLDIKATDTPPKGRLMALGTQRKGQPIDLTKAQGITDFTQVFLYDFGWVGLRANGKTISSNGRGERENIVKICPGLEQCFGLIDTQGRIGAIHPHALPWPPLLMEEVNRIGVVDFAMDTHHLIVLLKDGTARVWGTHYDTPEAVPERIRQERWERPPTEALKDVRSVAITPMSASTVTADGRLWTWGEAATAIPANAEALQGQYAAVVSSSSALYDARLRDGRVVSFNLSRKEAQVSSQNLAKESIFGGYGPLHQRADGEWFVCWNFGPALPPLLKEVRGQPTSAFSLTVFHEGGAPLRVGLLQIVAE